MKGTLQLGGNQTFASFRSEELIEELHNLGNLRGNKELSLEDIKGSELYKEVQESKSIIACHLSLSENEVEVLVNMAGYNPDLEVLALGNNFIAQSGKKISEEISTFPNLVLLNLDRTYLEDSDGIELAKILHTSVSLKLVSFIGNGFSNQVKDGMKQVSEAYKELHNSVIHDDQILPIFHQGMDLVGEYVGDPSVHFIFG